MSLIDIIFDVKKARARAVNAARAKRYRLRNKDKIIERERVRNAKRHAYFEKRRRTPKYKAYQRSWQSDRRIRRTVQSIKSKIVQQRIRERKHGNQA